MADTISRIKLEAQGADQAAREIRKLKEAYEDVATASKGIGASVGGGDPFAQAVAPGGVGGYASNAPHTVPQRGADGDRWRQQVTQRESRNVSMGHAGMGFLQTTESTMFQAGSGQSAGAFGSLAKGAGSLLGGTAGIALAAVGIGAYATQKLANTEKERIDRLYGGGQVQRLGMDYQTIRDWETVQGAKAGMRLENVQEFVSSASRSGLNATRTGVDEASGWALDANASMGLDTGTSARLLGAMSRANIGMGYASPGMYAVGKASFGTENMGKFIDSLTEMVETRSKQGIRVTGNAFMETQAMLGGLKAEGLSVDAAMSLTSRLESRAVSASGLNSPEDILALTALRGKDMSLTDAQIMMEENPGSVIEAVYERMKSQYSDDDTLNQALKNYTKGTMSETVALRGYLDKGMTWEEARDEMKREGGNWKDAVDYSGEQGMYQATQMQLLESLQENALELTTRVGQLAAKSRGISIGGTSANSIRFGDSLDLSGIFGDPDEDKKSDDGDGLYAFGDSYDLAGHLNDPNALSNMYKAAGYFGSETERALQKSIMDNPSGFGIPLSEQLKLIFPDMLEGIRADVRQTSVPALGDKVDTQIDTLLKLNPENYDSGNEIVSILNDLYFIINNYDGPSYNDGDGAG